MSQTRCKKPSVNSRNATESESDGRERRLYLTGPAVRILRRLARWNMNAELQRTDIATIEPPRLKWARIESLGLDGLRRMLGPMGDRPLEIRVPSHGTRTRARGIRCHVCTAPLPAGSFDRLILTNSEHVPDGTMRCEILVDAPPMALVDAAQRLMRSIRAGKITKQRALHRLIRLAVEDCSTYALHPWSPLTADALYDVTPVTDPVELCSCIDQMHKVTGAAFARDACGFAFAGAASPMEAFLAAALSLPSWLGGMGLDAPELNQGLDLTCVQARLLNHTESLTPDLLWRVYRILIEYFGDEPHTGKAARDEDSGRLQDYAVLGYVAFPVTYRHVRNPSVFNQFVVRLAHAMEDRGRKGTVAWVNELLADSDFLARQRILFAEWLPPVNQHE